MPELCLQVAPEDAFVSDELAVALEKVWGGLGYEDWLERREMLGI